MMANDPRKIMERVEELRRRPEGPLTEDDVIAMAAGIAIDRKVEKCEEEIHRIEAIKQQSKVNRIRFLVAGGVSLLAGAGYLTYTLLKKN